MSDLPETDEETYLGDGVYASFDGWQVWLRAPRENGDHKIALGPDEYQSLRRWISGFSLLKEHME